MGGSVCFIWFCTFITKECLQYDLIAALTYKLRRLLTRIKNSPTVPHPAGDKCNVLSPVFWSAIVKSTNARGQAEHRVECTLKTI